MCTKNDFLFHSLHLWMNELLLFILRLFDVFFNDDFFSLSIFCWLCLLAILMFAHLIHQRPLERPAKLGHQYLHNYLQLWTSISSIFNTNVKSFYSQSHYYDMKQMAQLLLPKGHKSWCGFNGSGFSLMNTDLWMIIQCRCSNELIFKSLNKMACMMGCWGYSLFFLIIQHEAWNASTYKHSGQLSLILLINYF